MLHIFLFSNAHVPTYCDDKCCTPPHAHTTSQVVYVKGSGGLQLNIDNVLSPFTQNEIIDVDCVFRDKIDQSTYDLHIGCGTCESNSLPETLSLSGYQKGVVEPFTQTGYYSIFPKKERKFNASLLLGCSSYFTIHLLDYKNRSNNKDIVWGAVIGIGESFTIPEILEFPVYILRNHGYVWNELPYTYFVLLFVASPIIVHMIRMCMSYSAMFKKYVLFPSFKKTLKNPTVNLVREILYEFSIFSFVASSLEELTHLVYVQIGKQIQTAFYIGLFGIVILANYIPVVFVYVNWYSLRKQWRISTMKFPYALMN